MTTFYFTFTGSAQSFLVPAGVTSIIVNVRGAAGGDGYPDTLGDYGSGGKAATVDGVQLSVTPGETLTVMVGGRGGNASAGAAGAGGWNGGAVGGYVGPSGWGYSPSGGGGGATDIRQGGTGLANRVIVAGGGGGAGANGSSNGGDGWFPSGLSGSNPRGGGGGTSSGGGPGGSGSVGNGANGTSGAGGAGASIDIRGGGGGGGGYYGGGGGGEGGLGTIGGGGGGGSSWLASGLSATYTGTWPGSIDGGVTMDFLGPWGPRLGLYKLG